MGELKMVVKKDGKVDSWVGRGNREYEMSVDKGNEEGKEGVG